MSHVKGIFPLGFFDIHCVAKYFKKLKGRPFGGIQKASKKSRIVPKKSE